MEMPVIQTVMQQQSSDEALFKKQTVSRSPATSILSSLLSSPKTTCSSPDLTSPSDSFSECDLLSRTGSVSPPVTPPPRKACVSFATVQPKSSPAITEAPTRDAKKHDPSLVSPERQTPHDAAPAISYFDLRRNDDLLDSDKRPVLGSVFDEFEENRHSPVFRDGYRAGQPKKL